jgi:YbbR domain-containing protein
MSSRFFQNNLTLKIISVIIAIILWLYAVSELNPEVTKNISDIPVTVMNEDALNGLQLTLAEKPADSITIRIRGLVNDIRKVNTANLKAVLDLKTVDWTGTRQVELNIEGLLPREVKLDKIPEISLTVDKVISKTVPVTVDRTGSGAKGYFVHPESVEPQTIGIYGAQSLVDSIVKGIVQVNLNNDESTIDQSLPIKLVDAANRVISSDYLNLRQGFATVRIPIYPVKSLAVKANITGVPANGFVVEGVDVNPGELTVNGYASVIEKLSSLNTEPVDITNAAEDVQITANIKEIEGLYLEPGQPSEIGIVVHIRETSIDKTITLNQINIKNIPAGFQAEIVSPAVTVQLKGPFTVVNPLTAQGLNPFVDISQINPGEAGLVPGQYELPLSIAVPQGAETTGMSADTVTVNITSTTETTTTTTDLP